MADADVISARYEDMTATFELFPEGELLTRGVTMQYSQFHAKHKEEFHSLPALVRYKNLLKEYPGVENVFPQHVLASYLKISPEYLSRQKARS